MKYARAGIVIARLMSNLNFRDVKQVTSEQSARTPYKKKLKYSIFKLEVILQFFRVPPLRHCYNVFYTKLHLLNFGERFFQI